MVQYYCYKLGELQPSIKQLTNIIVVFTNTADPLDLNFDPSELRRFTEIENERTFFINNTYCRVEKVKLRSRTMGKISMIERNTGKVKTEL